MPYTRTVPDLFDNLPHDGLKYVQNSRISIRTMAILLNLVPFQYNTEIHILIQEREQ